MSILYSILRNALKIIAKNNVIKYVAGVMTQLMVCRFVEILQQLWKSATCNLPQIAENRHFILCVFSRTLTSVHDAILEDVCFPAEIVGKRTRVKLDGSRLIKVHLDKNQQTNIEHKVGVVSTSRVPHRCRRNHDKSKSTVEQFIL